MDMTDIIVPKIGDGGLKRPRAKPLGLRGFRCQYTLRTLLIFVTVCSIAFCWLTPRMRAARRQREAARAILDAGGGITYDYEFGLDQRSLSNATPPGPAWLRVILGVDYFSDVVAVSVQASPDTVKCLDSFPKLLFLQAQYIHARPDDFRHLHALNSLEVASLDGSGIDDFGLEQLRGCTRLNSLSLSSTEISGAGLLNIEDLTALEDIDLSDTKIDDAGLSHLVGLTKLRDLNLTDTKVTDSGLIHLEKLFQLRCLRLANCSITDAGLVHLRKLSQLRRLDLTNCNITDAGLVNLKGLTELRLLSVNGRCTSEGFQMLESVLPHLGKSEVLRELPSGEILTEW